MRKEDINPAAQVQRLDRVLQAKALHGEISQTERFNVKRAWQLGKLLDEIKADCAHGEWTAKLTEMEIPQWRASECQRIAKLSAPLISTCHSIREAMKLVEEAEKGDKPTVPFAPAKPPAPDREPGDMTPEEEEQERVEAEQAAKIKAMLCARCARNGDGKNPLPACELCRGKAARIREGESVKPGVRTKPNDPRDKPTKNGQLCFDWGPYHHDYSKFKCQIDRLCDGYGVPIVHPKAEELRREADSLDKKFKAFAQEISKQKVPQA